MPISETGEILTAPFQLSPEQILKVILAQHWDMKACECWICQQARGCGFRATTEALNMLKTNREWLTLVQVAGRNH